VLIYINLKFNWVCHFPCLLGIYVPVLLDYNYKALQLFNSVCQSTFLFQPPFIKKNNKKQVTNNTRLLVLLLSATKKISSVLMHTFPLHSFMVFLTLSVHRAITLLVSVFVALFFLSTKHFISPLLIYILLTVPSTPYLLSLIYLCPMHF
jgi:hypothetical protein